MLKKLRSSLLPVTLLMAVLSGCAVPPSAKPVASVAVFYPAAPAAPRIQHLKTFTSDRDLGVTSSTLANFVLGDEAKEQRLKQPYGVAIFEGKIYVADSKAPGVAVFDLAAKKFDLITGSGGGRMRRPINVTIDTDGTKYVTDTGRNQVLVFNRADNFVAAYGAPEQFKPVDTAIIGEQLYVVDIGHHQVHVLDKKSGKPLFKFGTSGTQPGELFHPTNVAIGPEGDLYLVETNNYRVQRFTPEGKSVRTYGEVGTAPGNFARPKGIALDRSGRLFVGDAAFENVQVFDNSGKLLMFFGQPGNGTEGLSLPAGVAIDYDNLALFSRYADPKFTIEFLILVVSQFGPNKVDVFGFGKMSDAEYPPDVPAPVKKVP
jgi:DNA-binding beta-propeller fold protein YncE